MHPSAMRRTLPPAPRNEDSRSGVIDSTESCARLRSFRHHIPLKHDVKYIYAAANPVSPNDIYFFEYRCHGTPSPELGALGDVYIDLTSNSHALYAKCRVGWVRWSRIANIEHPFLTDTILYLSLEGVDWVHPTMVDKPTSQAHDAHSAILDMLIMEQEALRTNEKSRKQAEKDGRDKLDPIAAENGSRKRRRVDEELTFPPRNPEPPSSPLTPLRREDASISSAQHPSSPPRNKRRMDSRISGLQADITKLQDDLRELQLKNARVTQQNEKLVEEVEDLRDVNEKLKKERDELINTNGRSADNASAPDASSAMGERAPGDPNGTSSTCAEPCDKDLPGRFASDAGASKSERLPAEVRNLVNGHANNLSSFMDDMVDAQLRLQKATKTIADQKRHLNTMSVEVRHQMDARQRTETKHKEWLQAFNAWLIHVPKFEQEATR